MSKQIKIIHEGKWRIINLAQAADLIGMAKSTFSNHWRMREALGRSDQDNFDWIKSKKRGCYKKSRKSSKRVEAMTKNTEARVNAEIKPFMDIFLLGYSSIG